MIILIIFQKSQGFRGFEDLKVIIRFEDDHGPAARQICPSGRPNSAGEKMHDPLIP